MKKTGAIDFFKTIRKSLVSFISIAVFAMLGVSLFIGMSWSSNSLRESANTDCINYKLYDIQLQSLYGFDDDDIEKFKFVDPTVTIDTFNSATETCEFNGISSNVQVAGIMSNLNQFNYVDGTLPSEYNEIAVTKKFAELKDIKIGDSITFKHNSTTSNHLLYALVHSDKNSLKEKNTSGMKYLNSDTFKVTALVNNVNTLSNSPISLGISQDNLQIESVFYVDNSAFDMKSFPDYKTLMIRSDELSKYEYYSEKYKEKCNELADKYQQCISSYSLEKYENIREGIINVGIMGPNINNFQQHSITTLTRNQSGGIASVETSYKGMHNLRWSLSGMLIGIVLLVTYSVITRLVFEQRISIGTKKALGFPNKRINIFFLAYTLFATLIGCIGGYLLGRFVIEPLAFAQVKNNFTIAANTLGNKPLEVIILCISEIALLLLTTFVASNKTLKKDAVVLLQNNDQAIQKERFYEKTKLWQKTPLISKTVVNNLFTDKRRVFATLIGIISSTALVTCGITFSNNVTKSSKYHYNELQNFDTIVYCSDKSASDCSKNISMKLEEDGLQTAAVYYTTTILQNNNDNYSVNIFVAEDDKFDQLFKLKTKNNKEHSITENAIFMNESLGNELEIKNGDSTNYVDAFGAHPIKINFIVKYNLIGSMLFMNKSTYMTQFNVEDVSVNAVIVNRGDVSISQLNQKLKDVHGFISIYDFKEMSLITIAEVASGFTMLSSLYLIMSFATAFLVILNLLITFVDEKKRDLTILMINGYERKKVKKYIYSDTIFLTTIGIIVGVCLGFLFARLSLNSITSASVFFVNSFNLLGAVLGVIVTGALVVLMSIISLARINKFSLTDIERQ